MSKSALSRQYILTHAANDFTATNYADLYCDGQDARSLIQSAPYIGSIIGLLFLTPFADSKGKKKIFVLSQGLMILGITSRSSLKQ